MNKIIKTWNSIKRSFTSGFNQQTPNQKITPLTPPASLTGSFQSRTVAACRDLAQTDSYGRGIVATFIGNIVGEQGVVLTVQTDDSDLNSRVIQAWNKFIEQPITDDGITNFVNLQQQVVRALLTDGEMFLHIKPDVETSMLTVAPLDPPRIPYNRTGITQDGEYYRNGFLFGVDGKLKGYLLNSESVLSYNMGNPQEVIPANEVMHIALKQQVGQYRGYPLLGSVAGRINKISIFENAALENATSGAKKFGFMEWDKDAELAPDVELEFSPSKDGSGAFVELPPGLSVNAYEGKFPDEAMPDFTRAILLAASQALAISYPSLSGDLVHVNFSSIRQATLAERRTWRAYQQFMAREMVIPLFELWLLHAITTKEMPDVPMQMYDAIVESVVPSFVNWDSIDPRNEAIADQRRLQDMQVSISSLIRSRGLEPQSVYQEIARDLREMVDAGIPEALVHDVYLRQPNVLNEILEGVSNDEPTITETST